MFAWLTVAVALRTTSSGSDSRNTFFHAEPTCFTIGRKGQLAVIPGRRLRPERREGSPAEEPRTPSAKIRAPRSI